MAANLIKKIAFYPNRKIFSQKFIRWNAELDERKNIFDIMGTLKQFIVCLFVDFVIHLFVGLFVGVLGLHALFSML